MGWEKMVKVPFPIGKSLTGQLSTDYGFRQLWLFVIYKF
jgi:hypothetical protein